MLLLGGTGISHVLSQLLSIIAAARQGRSATRRAHLIWHVRHAENIEWIAPLLNSALTPPLSPDTLQLVIEVYVTRSTVGSDPSDETALSTLANPTPQTPANEKVVDAYATPTDISSRSNASHIQTETSTPSSEVAEKHEMRRDLVFLGSGLAEGVKQCLRLKVGRADLKEAIRLDVAAARGRVGVTGESTEPGRVSRIQYNCLKTSSSPLILCVVVLCF